MAKESREEKRPVLATTVEFDGTGLTKADIARLKAEPAAMGALPSRIVEAILSSAAEQLKANAWPKVIWKESWGNWPNALVARARAQTT